MTQPQNKNTDWQNRDKHVVWHPFTQVQTEAPPIPMVKAKGTLLFDANGKSYIDCNSSWWVNVHGHGNEKIQAAIADQFSALDHVLLAGVTHPKAITLAENVIDLLGAPFAKVFYSDNGSTAIEVAIKMVMQYWYNQGIQKNKMLAIDGAYHGDTFGAMSLGQRGYFNKPFEAFFFDADYLPFPNEDNKAAVLQKAAALFATGQFAGFIVEPLVQGSAGMRMYSPEILQELVSLAHKHQVLVIFDEVMTAWGRTGKMFAMEHLSVKPDIICLSKGLTGGVLPMGLTVTNDSIFAQFLSDEKVKALLHGHSYTGNALACAAACASIALFHQDVTKQNILRIVKKHEDFVTQLGNHPALLDARQCGTILALEIDTQSESSYFSSIRDVAYHYFIEHGMLLRPLGNVVFLNPPYCITDSELEHCYYHLNYFINHWQELVARS